MNTALGADCFQTEEILVQNQTDFLCHLVKHYLFSVLVFAFLCFYSMAEYAQNYIPSLRNLCQRETSKNAVNGNKYILMHPRDHAHSECVSYVYLSTA